MAWFRSGESSHKHSLLIFLLSFPGTISCQKCVTSSSPPHFTEHLIWIKLKLLPHHSAHTFFPFFFPRTVVTKLDKLLISTKAISMPFTHQSQQMRRAKSMEEAPVDQCLLPFCTVAPLLQVAFPGWRAADEFTHQLPSEQSKCLCFLLLLSPPSMTCLCSGHWNYNDESYDSNNIKGIIDTNN